MAWPERGWPGPALWPLPGLKTVSLSSSSALRSAKHASDPGFGEIDVKFIIGGGGSVVLLRKRPKKLLKKELYTVLPMVVTQW